MAERMVIDSNPGVEGTVAAPLVRGSPEVELRRLTSVFGNCGIAASQAGSS